MSVESIIKPLRPSGVRWRGPYQPGAAARVAIDNDGKSNGPEYHISIARQTPDGPARCSSAIAFWALDQFGLEGSEEDNHVEHGVVRNFWRPVAEPLIGRECECKASEPRVIEDGGDFVSRPA